MFRIGDFSKICQVPVSSLRYYADIGLLEPCQIDRFTGYRYYVLDQLPRLNRILALKDLGLSLEQIKLMLEEDISPAEIRGMLKLKQAEIQQQVRDEQERLARVEARLRQIEQEGEMPHYDVILKSIEPQHIIALRTLVPTIPDIGPLWGVTYQTLLDNSIDETAPCFSIDYTEEWTGKDMDLELVYPVADSVKQTVKLDDGREMKVRELEGVSLAAATVHKGEYSGLSDAYTSLARWIQENGYHINGPAREIYLRGGGPEAVTEILFPIKKA